MTRKEMWERHAACETAEQRSELHSEYYAGIVEAMGLRLDHHRDLGKWIMWYANDPHMNQPGNRYWDVIAAQRLDRGSVQRALRAIGDGWSNAADTCILKEAARQAIARAEVTT